MWRSFTRREVSDARTVRTASQRFRIRASRRAENSRCSVGIALGEIERIAVMRAPAQAGREDAGAPCLEPRFPGRAGDDERSEAAIPLPRAGARRRDRVRCRASDRLRRICRAEPCRSALGGNDERQPFRRTAARAIGDHVPWADAVAGRLFLRARHRDAGQPRRFHHAVDAAGNAVGAVDRRTERARELGDRLFLRPYPVGQAAARARGAREDGDERDKRDEDVRDASKHRVREADRCATSLPSG